MTTVAEAIPDVEQAAHDITHPYQVESTFLGPSKIATYLRCPRAYKYQYIDREPSLQSPAAALGSCVHAVIKMAHGGQWTPANLDDAADALDQLWSKVRGFTSDPEDPDAAKSVREATDVWLPWYLSWTQGQLNVCVEERWQVEVPEELTDGLPVTLQGTIDRVYRQSGETVISDVKTGKRAPSAQDLATDLQMSVYSWAYRQMSRQNREDALEIVQVRSKQTLRTYRSDAYLDRVIRDVVTPTAQAIKAGLFPANPSTKFGCGYCGYQDVCVVGRGCGDPGGDN